MSWSNGKYSFNGIVNGTLMAVVGYQVLRALAKASGNHQD